MSVSVIVPWRGRAVLERTLRENTERFVESNAEVIVVNGGGDRDCLRELIRRSRCRSVRMVHLFGMDEFNKSVCLNLGISFGRGESIFLLDADIILSTPFLEEALTQVEKATCFASVAEVIETDPGMQPERWVASSPILRKVTTTELIRDDGHVASAEYGIGRDGTRTGPGLMVVRKQHAVAVQGFNSALTGWGFEDYDFQFRLQLALGVERRTLGKVHHVSHQKPDTRESNQRNRKEAYRNYDRGDYLGTYDMDVAKWGGNAAEETA